MREAFPAVNGFERKFTFSTAPRVNMENTKSQIEIIRFIADYPFYVIDYNTLGL